MPDQPKIHEAYAMLKKQGIAFPSTSPSDFINVPVGDGVDLRFSFLTPKFLDVPAESFADRKSPLEHDERKSKVLFVFVLRCSLLQLLAKLLQSKDPNDLIRANKLIKRMVVEVFRILECDL